MPNLVRCDDPSSASVLTFIYPSADQGLCGPAMHQEAVELRDPRCDKMLLRCYKRPRLGKPKGYNGERSDQLLSRGIQIPTVEELLRTSQGQGPFEEKA